MARRSDLSPAAVVVAAIIGIGLVILIVKWLLITAAILVVPFAVWAVCDHLNTTGKRQAEADRAAHAEARRREVESRAVIDAAGGCGWCGMASGHRDHRTGRRITPRAYHHHDIEATLARHA